MTENEVKKNGWGGKRPGQGRPKGSKNKVKKLVSEARPQHQLRAFPDEWELILKFAAFIKHGKREACERALTEIADMRE